MNEMDNSSENNRMRQILSVVVGLVCWGVGLFYIIPWFNERMYREGMIGSVANFAIFLGGMIANLFMAGVSWCIGKCISQMGERSICQKRKSV